ncbi:MAG: hypothetical protein ACK4SF_04625 [Algoriphagus aquaeductus]|uniref:hypothetical protein n=1 Tax=Algoriphagus aquaeductus TaxID=475299 RepID=UPI00391A2177
MNRIGVILKDRGIEDLAPSQKILDELQVKLHTWNKWVHNKKDPEMWQLPIIARFLDVEITDLFPAVKDQSIRAKHGLISA